MKKILIISLILATLPTFAWDILRNNKGSLTGYSTPINQNAYQDLELDLMQKLKPKNNMTDLFSSPKTNYDYNSNNLIKGKRGGGIGAQTGVTIIYD